MKPILFLLAALALPAILFGQGQVNFNNTSATLITTNFGFGRSGPISGVNAFRIGLYTAPAGTVNESLFTLVAVATNSSLLAGRIGGFFVDTPNGNPISFQVKAWSLSAGASYEAAITTGFGVGGKSSIGGVTPATGGTPPPILFSSTAGVAEFPGQLTSGIVIGIPEPGTLALVALGAAILGATLRRRS